MHPRLKGIAIDVLNGNLTRLAALRLDRHGRGSRNNTGRNAWQQRVKPLAQGAALGIGSGGSHHEILSQAKSTGAFKSAIASESGNREKVD